MFLVSKTEEMIHFDDRFYSNTVGEANVQPVCRAWCKSSILLRVVGGALEVTSHYTVRPFSAFWGCYGCFVKRGGGLEYGRVFELFLNLRQKINVYDFSLIHTNGHFFHPLILGKQKSTRVPHRNLRLNLLEVNLGQEEPPVAHRFP